MSSTSHPLFKIIVSGVTFNLSEASLRSDSPDTNLLAMALLGDFAEANDKTLVLDRSAVCFAIIRDHLSGYTILPLDPSVCAGLDESRVLRYLKDDAKYYGLARLEKLVSKEMDKLASNREEKMDSQARDADRRYTLDETRVRLALHEARVNGRLQHIEAIRAQHKQISTWSLETLQWEQGIEDNEYNQSELLDEIRVRHTKALRDSLDALGQLVEDVPTLSDEEE